ncbi:MAG: NUMOD4 motif-containing HNH endonuclease [Desulfobacteraceae bacterium]|nr:NUMOD4 motif-containing HNH endonuclease [Desulfobacteraceae bacterium]
MSTEIWRSIVGYDDYEASSLGRIRSWKKWRGFPVPRIMTQVKNKKGYWTVGLFDRKVKTRLVHGLIAESFIQPRPSVSHRVDHRDDNRENNRADNLAWLTNQENISKGYALRRTLPTGVYERYGRFEASSEIGGYYSYLGRFDTVEDAQKAYKAATDSI